MAITMTKEPTGLYPAYNSSYIEFTSNLVDNYKAEVVVTALSNETFTIFPEVGGSYILDLKDIVKTLINGSGFKNMDNSYPVSWTEAYPYGYLSLDITIKTYNTSTNDSLAKTYTFIRGVKQLNEEIFPNEYQLLHGSANGVDYYLTYFEGYPFSFEISRATVSDRIVFRNLNSGDYSSTGATVSGGAFVASTKYRILSVGTTDFTSIGAASNTVGLVFTASGSGAGTGTATTYTPFTAVSTNTQRVWIDKATENWNTATYLPLTDTLNRLEVIVNEVIETNVNVKKIGSRCGVYLRWFNANGGYSYWLFDEFYKSTINSSNRGNVGSNVFNNVGSHTAPFISTGKQARESYRLRAIVDQREADHLRDLVTSPSVELYGSFDPFIDANFIDVEVKSGYVYSNKKRLNEVIINIELPELLTPTL